MTAHEQHEQAVVTLDHLGCVRSEARREAFPIAPGVLASPLVDQAARCRLDQPGGGLGWHPFAGPVRRCGNERFLDRVLGGIEITAASGERADDLRRELAQQVIDID